MISTPIRPDLLRGAVETETTARGLRPHRLPSWARHQVPDPQLLMAEAQPSGVRLVVMTASRTLELVAHASRVGYRGVDRPRGSFDLVVDGALVATDLLTGGDLVEVDLRTGGREVLTGPAHTARFDGLPEGEKLVELWLPHTESLELIELRSDDAVHPVPATGRRWLHHGSSISHGSNAATPTGIWPVVAARAAGVELQSLGFGGSALVDPFMARVIRDSPADVISLKLGINVVNLDSMRLRSFVPAVHGFLDTIRDGHPDTPLLLVSPIFCGIHEDTPGPGSIDPASIAAGRVRFTATGDPADAASGRLTLRVIRDALASVMEGRGDDPNLSFLDGLALYGEADSAEHPLPDALHPDSATHRLIGERFHRLVFGPDGPFGRAGSAPLG